MLLVESNKMLKKTRSAGLNFEIVFDKEKETWIQKVKRWCAKMAPPFDLLFLYLFSFVEEWYVDSKIELEMDRVDKQTSDILDQWEQQDAPEAPVIVEKTSEVDGLTGLSISNPVVDSRSIPDPWANDWNDSIANIRLWVDKDMDHK